MQILIFICISDDDDNDEYEEGDDLCPIQGSSSPPALPPKRTIRMPASLHHVPPNSTTPKSPQAFVSTVEDRIIPIVREVDGSVIVPNRSSTDTPAQQQLSQTLSSFNIHHHSNNRRASGQMGESANTQLGLGLSEGEANDQSASSNTSVTTSSSGLGTSTTGEHLHHSDEVRSYNRYHTYALVSHEANRDISRFVFSKNVFPHVRSFGGSFPSGLFVRPRGLYKNI